MGLNYRIMAIDPTSVATHCWVADLVTKIVCREMDVTIEELRSRTRIRKISDARQVSMWMIKNKTHLTFSQIGKRFNRDHATAMFSVNQINSYIGIKNDIGLRALKIAALYEKKN